MSLPVAAEPAPLTVDSDEVMRIAGTRVALETVILAFDAGSTPEEIVQDYPALELNDIYAVVTYYLRHRDEVVAFLIHDGRVDVLMARSVATIQRLQTGSRLFGLYLALVE